MDRHPARLLYTSTGVGGRQPQPAPQNSRRRDTAKKGQGSVHVSARALSPAGPAGLPPGPPRKHPRRRDAAASPSAGEGSLRPLLSSQKAFGRKAPAVARSRETRPTLETLRSRPSAPGTHQGSGAIVQRPPAPRTLPARSR